MLIIMAGMPTIGKETRCGGITFTCKISDSAQRHREEPRTHDGNSVHTALYFVDIACSGNSQPKSVLYYTDHYNDLGIGEYFISRLQIALPSTTTLLLISY